jgi:hypothetical protein
MSSLSLPHWNAWQEAVPSPDSRLLNPAVVGRHTSPPLFHLVLLSSTVPRVEGPQSSDTHTRGQHIFQGTYCIDVSNLHFLSIRQSHTEFRTFLATSCRSSCPSDCPGPGMSRHSRTCLLAGYMVGPSPKQTFPALSPRHLVNHHFDLDYAPTYLLTLLSPLQYPHILIRSQTPSTSGVATAAFARISPTLADHQVALGSCPTCFGKEGYPKVLE